MDTHGHHRVLLEGVEPRLRRAYAEKGDDDVNLQALFLGNWLADLSQVNDPGSTAITQIARDLRARKATASTATRIVSQVLVALVTAEQARTDARPQAATGPSQGAPGPPGTEAAAIAALARYLRDRTEQLLIAVAVVAQTLEGDAQSGSASSLGTTLLSLTRALGYLKFAVPESNAGGHRIDYASYTRIFEELCRQYFPHEHLDRPLCSASYGPQCEAAWGSRHAGRRDRLYASATGTDKDRHMYQYLVDDRTIIAGRLAELDLHWASRDLVAATIDRAERDLWLARLGHALRGVEDFFAHSNFTEHAILAASGPAGMADALKRRPVRRAGEPPDDAVPAASNKVSRRLRRYSPELETEAAGLGEPEPLVATGYFDGWDTLNSMLHLAEELVRPALHRWETRERADPVVVTVRALLVQYADDIVGDILDLFELEPLDRPDSRERRIHQALDGLIEYVAAARAADEAQAMSACMSYVRDDPVLAALPGDLLRTHLAPAVLSLTRGVKIAKVEWTVYKAIKSITEFADNPTKYLLKPLTDEAHFFLLKAYLAAAAELVGKDLLVKLNYALLTELQRLFRADRIGCHSLMAKDQETEPLFAEMFRCARHVDWFVADSLCRWSDREWVAATDDTARWVRWDALLGAYLRAPADSPTVRTRRVTWRDATVLRRFAVEGPDDDFRTLHRKLAARVGIEAQWIAGYEEFLMTNLGEIAPSLYAGSPVAGTAIDEARVAQVAAAAGMGSYDGRRLRLWPGLEVVLPVTMSVPVDVTVHTSWFGDVLTMTDDEWRDASMAYERERLRMSSPEFQHYRLEFLSGVSPDNVRRQVTQRIAAGRTLRENLEIAYNGTGGAAGP